MVLNRLELKFEYHLKFSIECTRIEPTWSIKFWNKLKWTYEICILIWDQNSFYFCCENFWSSFKRICSVHNAYTHNIHQTTLTFHIQHKIHEHMTTLHLHCLTNKYKTAAMRRSSWPHMWAVCIMYDSSMPQIKTSGTEDC